MTTAVLPETAPPGSGSAGTGAASADVLDDTFVRLGGDSLGAMRLAGEAAAALGVAIPVTALLGSRPVRRVLAEALSAARFSAPATAAVPGSATPGAASAAQRGMWIHEQVVGSSPYNLVFISFIDGNLRKASVVAALAGTIGRHEGLRTVFTYADGNLERNVTEDSEPQLEWRAWAGRPAGFDDYVREVAATEGGKPFDLGTRPGLRFIALSQENGARHALILCAHHILLDGWAVGLVLREVFARYESVTSGTALSLVPAVTFDSYLDRLSMLRSVGDIDRQAQFWRRSLASAPTVIDLPANRARPRFAGAQGARHPVDLGPGLTRDIQIQARRLGITPAAFLVGALGITLARYTGMRSLLVGTPVAGRPTPELAGLVGVTTNIVPVLIEIDDSQSVRAYLRGVHGHLAQSLENSDIPFQELVKLLDAVGSGDRHPLVQVCFGMHDDLIPQRLRSADLKIRIEEGYGGGSQFDLQFFVRQKRPSLAGDLEYATAVWESAEAAAFCADLTAAARELAESGGRRLEDVRCLAPQQRARLHQVNETGKPYPLTSVDEAFREQASRTPRHVAVRDEAGHLTYEELSAAAAAQARVLADAGVRPGSTVLIAVPRSAAEVVAVLGTVWAGAAYVGIEADTPRRRLEQIVSTLAPAAVIGSGLGPLPGVAELAPWDRRWSAQERAGLPGLAPDPERLAYIAFTSGSTGMPKGVCIPHRAVLRLVHGLPGYAPVTPDDRVLRFAPLAFDASTLELWGALLTGASLVIHPPGLPAPAALGSFISRQAVTVAWLTSGLFRLMADYAAESLGGLRVLLTGGDVVPAEPVRRLLARHRGLAVVNGYGPTENTTFTTTYRMTDPGDVRDPVPIGMPVANTRVYVLDQRQRLLPPGAVGELYTAGDGLATGYYGDLGQTRQSFGQFSPDLPDFLYRTGDVARLDSDGRLQFLGRADDQVKIRGFRVELSEIRAALASHPAVADAFVTVSREDHGDTQLLACCIPAAGDLDVPAVADYLSAIVPGYMVPALWAVVRELPLTANGKVDRAALRRCARLARSYRGF